MNKSNLLKSSSLRNRIYGIMVNREGTDLRYLANTFILYPWPGVVLAGTMGLPVSFALGFGIASAAVGVYIDRAVTHKLFITKMGNQSEFRIEYLRIDNVVYTDIVVRAHLDNKEQVIVDEIISFNEYTKE